MIHSRAAPADERRVLYRCSICCPTPIPEALGDKYTGMLCILLLQSFVKLKPGDQRMFFTL